MAWRRGPCVCESWKLKSSGHCYSPTTLEVGLYGRFVFVRMSVATVCATKVQKLILVSMWTCAPGILTPPNLRSRSPMCAECVGLWGHVYPIETFLVVCTILKCLCHRRTSDTKIWLLSIMVKMILYLYIIICCFISAICIWTTRLSDHLKLSLVWEKAGNYITWKCTTCRILNILCFAQSIVQQYKRSIDMLIVRLL